MGDPCPLVPMTKRINDMWFKSTVFDIDSFIHITTDRFYDKGL